MKSKLNHTGIGESAHKFTQLIYCSKLLAQLPAQEGSGIARSDKVHRNRLGSRFFTMHCLNARLGQHAISLHSGTSRHVCYSSTTKAFDCQSSDLCVAIHLRRMEDEVLSASTSTVDSSSLDTGPGQHAIKFNIGTKSLSGQHVAY